MVTELVKVLLCGEKLFVVWNLKMIFVDGKYQCALSTRCPLKGAQLCKVLLNFETRYVNKLCLV